MPSQTQRDKLEDALRRTFFAHRDDAYFASPGGQKDLNDHVERRFRQCRDRVVPWVSRYTDLERAEVLEIGCGTGSSTAAFAERARHVYGYDISEKSIDAARLRLEILGISNASCFCVEPEALLDRAMGDHADGVDMILLYAVLEHQLVHERLETLRRCWELLRPGGLLVVSDTPNRLCYEHYHTSEIPFFDMLPESLALQYWDRSPRQGFREGMRAAVAVGPERASEVLGRWGTGVSHHEFELAIGEDLQDLVVGDGFDPEILTWKPMHIEEQVLLEYLLTKGLPVPRGFSRISLDLVLRKPGGEIRSDPPRGDTPEVRRSGVVTRPTVYQLAAGDDPAPRFLIADFRDSAAAPAPPAPLPPLPAPQRTPVESLSGRQLLGLALRKGLARLTGTGSSDS